MGAHVPDMEPAENATAEALLSSLKTIAAAERRKHASVFNYWLSIRGDRQFPPIRDLDPLEISDAGPWSVLLEMIGGGDDAVVRHLGQAIKADADVEMIGTAPNPSLLSCIHAKLPIVASSRQAFAFEDKFETDEGTRSCWVTLLPFSETGTWIDYVYGFVSLDPAPGGAEEAAPEGPQAVEEASESASEEPDPSRVPLRPFFEEPNPLEDAVAAAEAAQPAPEPENTLEPQPEPEFVQDPAAELEPEPEPEPVAELGPDLEPEPEPVATASPDKPGFSTRILEGLASVGFYGKVVEAPAPVIDEAELEQLTPVIDEAVLDVPDPVTDVASLEEPNPVIPETEPPVPSEVEGTLQSKLAEAQALAEEARLAKLRSVTALQEGLSVAYDFALDAEQEPEEYLKLVEARGLKIQLRSPMKPVVKLAFDGACDDETIAQLETVLAWALKLDLPRGSLAERIAAEGGIEAVLEGLDRAA